jgi:hypothetical protein
MLFGETVAVYCENHTEHINTLCGAECRVLCVKHPVAVDIFRIFPVMVFTCFTFTFTWRPI